MEETTAATATTRFMIENARNKLGQSGVSDHVTDVFTSLALVIDLPIIGL